MRAAVAARMGVIPPRAMALHSVRPRPLGGRACTSAAVRRSRPQRAVLLRAAASESQPAGEDDDRGTDASKAAGKALDDLQMGVGPDDKPRDEWVRS